MTDVHPPVQGRTATPFTATAGKRCGCCWRDRDDDGAPLALGALAFPQRKTFLICGDCIAFMWHGRHPMAQGDDE